MQTLSHHSPRPLLASLLLLLAASRAPSAEAKVASIEIPCVEFSSAISVPCLCSLNEVNATRINCDNVVFPGDFPVLPLRYYIQEFSQQGAGWQQLPAQIFTASDIPLKIVDFSHNSMRRLAVRQVLFTSFYIDTNGRYHSTWTTCIVEFCFFGKIPQDHSDISPGTIQIA